MEKRYLSAIGVWTIAMSALAGKHARPDQAADLLASGLEHRTHGWQYDLLRMVTGQTLTLLDVDGPGEISHLWFTWPLSLVRVGMVRRITWKVSFGNSRSFQLVKYALAIVVRVQEPSLRVRDRNASGEGSGHSLPLNQFRSQLSGNRNLSQATLGLPQEQIFPL